MIIKQFYLDCLAHASYLVVDERTRRAAVIDPQRDIQQYLDAAEALDAKIEYVLLTHFHADFVAGHLELRDRVDASICLGARGSAEYDYRALEDGEVIELGDVRLTTLETPGHTPESVCYTATDTSKDRGAPEAVFTGDTLFVGDVGRPDLLASVGVSADDLAGWLYDSLHQKLMPLPDDTIVYPAHGAGSLCGKNLGKETHSTIGHQRATNYALQPMTKGEFKAIVTVAQPEAPGYFLHDAVMNKQERATLSGSLAESLRPLSMEDVASAQADGAVVLDVRASDAFAAGHVQGSVNVGLDGKFATWAGTLVAPDARIVVVAEPGREEEAALRLGRIGLDGVVGFLDGGATAIQDGCTLTSITPEALSEQLESGAQIPVVDVRTAREWETAHIEGSLNIPLTELPRRLDEIPSGEVAVICRSGYRSSAACSVIARNGKTELRNVVGGMEEWGARALPQAVTEGAAGSCSA